MVGRQDDEATPLVQRQEQPVTRTPRIPLPWNQLWVVLLVQASEAFASHALAPFTPQVSISSPESHYNRNFVKLIRDIGVTHGDESLVGYYVGILVSVHATFFIEPCSTLTPSPAIIILCRSSTDCSPLESTVGSHWAEACVTYRSIRDIVINVLVWVLKDFSWSIGQVRMLNSCPDRRL